MSKAYKAGPSKAGRTAPAGPASHRLNLRAVICLVVAVPLSAGGLFAWKAYSGRANLSHYLAEAKRAMGDKQPEMALTYIGYYLQGDPQNLEALEIKGRALAEVARSAPGVEEAIRVQTQILARDPERMEARKQLIELNLKIQRYRAAQAAAIDYLKRGADDAEAHRLMARALEGVGYLGDTKALDGDPGEPEAPYAIAEFEKAEKLQPGNIDGGSRLAEIYVSRGKDPARAVEVMDKILEANPKAIAARLARLRFFIRHPELAAKSAESRKVRPRETLVKHELDEALKIAPGDVDAGLLAAEAALTAGDTARARDCLAAIQPPPKDDLRLNLIKGMIEFREQRPDEGVQSWRAGLIQGGGTSADLHWRLARVLIGLNRLGEARQHMAQYRRLSGGSEPNPEYRYLEALLCLRTNRIKEAVPILEALRDRTGRSGLLTPAHHLITLGDAYAAARDEARAIDTYGQAAHLAGAGPQPWMSMARVHQLADRPAEAIAALEGGLAAAPDDAGLLVALAQALRQQELAKPKDRRDWAELRRRLEQAEQAAPGSPEVALIRADLLADEGRLGDALKGIEAVVARAPTAVGPWLARIGALTRLGRLDEALEATDAAIKAAGDHAQFRVAKARILDRRGEPRKAYEALAGGMDRVPPDQRPQLRRALGEFHQGRGDLEAARRDYEEWALIQPEAYEPRLALLNLANAKGDGPAMEAQVAALREVVGPDAVIGKVVRAQVLLNLRPRSDDGRSGEDKARLDEVAKLAAEVKAATPRGASGLLLEAQLMARLGRTDAEIAAYRAALELRGGQAALKPLVTLLSKAGREREYEELRRKAPAFPAELDQIATALMLQRGDTDKAEQLADRMVQGDPQGLDAAVWKAKLLNTLGKPDEAEKWLRFFADQQPENPGAWIQLLMFQVSRGEAEKARATLDRMKGQPRLNTERPELIWAACYRALNMRPEADEEFAKALGRWPDDPGVNQVAVDYYESSGRPELAEAALRHLLAARPGFDWARRRLALNLSAKPNSPEALSEAMSLVDASSGADSPEDRQLRAVVLARSADPKHRGEAIAILEALAAEVPEASRAKLHETLARSLIVSSEQARAAGDEALAAADRAKAVDHAAKAAAPENAPADIILFHAILRLQDKDFDAVEKALARLEKTDAKALATIELRARLLHAQGKDAESEAQILGAFEARKASPDAIAAGVGLLRVLMSMKRDDAAERLGAELAKLNVRGQLAFAEYLAGRGKAKEARDLLDAVSKAGGAADAARVAISMASEQGGEWMDHADGLLRLALKGKSDSVDLVLSQAHLRHLRRDYPAEVELYKEIVAKNPNNYLFLNNMAWTLSEEMGQPEEGVRRIDEAIAKAGRQSHLIDTRGVILLRLGRIDEAIKDLEAAVVALPTAPIYFHMARAYKKAGREPDFAKYRDLARKAGLRPEQLQPSERDEAEKLVGFPAPDSKKS